MHARFFASSSERAPAGGAGRIIAELDGGARVAARAERASSGGAKGLKSGSVSAVQSASSLTMASSSQLFVAIRRSLSFPAMAKTALDLGMAPIERVLRMPTEGELWWLRRDRKTVAA